MPHDAEPILYFKLSFTDVIFDLKWQETKIYVVQYLMEHICNLDPLFMIRNVQIPLKERYLWVFAFD